MDTTEFMPGDPTKVASNVYRTVFENEHMRLLEARLRKGQKAAMHHHPKHLVYILEPGKERFTYSDGRVEEAKMKAGDAIWVEEMSHSSENIGKTTVHALIIELK
jgi:quercetin dioxygenase-like cupin family protein